MPLTTVAHATATAQKVPLCSCNWKGQPTSDMQAAWREANAHARDKHGTTAGLPRRASSTASATPPGETRG